MKVLALALLLVAAASAKVAVHSTRAEGPACPPEDPLDRPEEGPLNITFHPIAEIHQGGSRSEVHVTGLSSFTYTYDINLIALTATFEIRVTGIDLTSGYDATGYLDARPFSESCIPSGNFTGSGTALVTAAGVRVVGSGTLFINLITDKVSIRILAVTELAFSSISVDLGADYMIGGNPIDWPAFNANLKPCVDSEFAANNAAIVEKIRVGINEKIGIFSLEEFLDFLIGGGGDGGCDPK